MKGRESGMPDEGLWASFFNPDCVLDKLGVNTACRDVVEFGCGYGTFAVPAARRISGTVYALDIDPEMVAATSRKAAESGLANVAGIRQDFVTQGTGRPNASVDIVLLLNILHIEAPLELLRETFRILVPGGCAGIIHWRTDRITPRGPPMDIRPEPAQCRTWGEAVGLNFVRYEELACCPWHWGLVLQRPFA